MMRKRERAPASRMLRRLVPGLSRATAAAVSALVISASGAYKVHKPMCFGMFGYVPNIGAQTGEIQRHIKRYGQEMFGNVREC